MSCAAAGSGAGAGDVRASHPLSQLLATGCLTSSVPTFSPPLTLSLHLQEGAVRRIMRIYNTSFQIGLVCMNPEGQIGAAAQGWTFTYAMASTATNNQSVAIQVAPLPPLAA